MFLYILGFLGKKNASKQMSFHCSGFALHVWMWSVGISDSNLS